MTGGPDEYWRQHGLEGDPFPAVRADGFSDDDLKRRLDLLVYLIQSGDQMVLVRGERGSGKSALLRRFLASAGERFTVCLVQAGPGFNPVRLLVALSQAFADRLSGGDSEDLGERLATIQRDGGTPLLVVDDVEQLSAEALDTVLELYERMGESGRLLRVVMVGAPNAADRLGEHPRFRKYGGELRTLDVPPLAGRQIEAYLAWCVEGAGGTLGSLFSTAQLRSIVEESGGLPGRINEVARQMLGGGPAIEASGGGAMNLGKLRELDIKKVLTWSGVALLLLAILIFQGQINDMIQGDAVAPPEREGKAPQSVAIQRGVGEMPQGRLPEQVVREPVRRAEPPPMAPPGPSAVESAAVPAAGIIDLEPSPLPELPVEGETRAVAEAPQPAAAEAEAGMPVAAEAGAAAMMAGDPLAGAPLEHRIPHLEKPTPFEPSAPEVTAPVAPEPASVQAPVAPPVAEPLAPAAAGEKMASHPAEGPVAAAGAAASPAPATPEGAQPAADQAEGETAPAASPGVTPPVEEKPVETPAAEKVALKDEGWLMEQPPGHIALQVLGGADRDALVAFAEGHGLVANGAIFHGDNRGRSWYGLLSGVYPDLAAAREALKALPALSPGYAPWTRSIASVQKEIEKVRRR